MIGPTRYGALSAPSQWLVRKCQEIAFGRLSFTVRGGTASPGDPVRVSRTHKLVGHDHPRPQLGRADFVLKAEYVDLLRHLRTLADGTVVTVKVVAGLPTSTIDVEEVHHAA